MTFFQAVFKLRPNYLQSYLDLADTYESLGQLKKALSLYVRATNLVNSGFIVAPSEEGLLYNFDRSYDSFLKRNKDVFADLDFEWDSEEAGTEVTLYFDETETEFELFFVNPENQYFTENYSTWENLDLINNNKALGLSSLEFFIDQNLRGEWKVYLKYLGNKKQTPSSVKLIARSKYPNSGKTPLVLFKKLTAEDEIVLLGTLTN
jgi:tetratricopeptide (TPR) repeat protein